MIVTYFYCRPLALLSYYIISLGTKDSAEISSNKHSSLSYARFIDE